MKRYWNVNLKRTTFFTNQNISNPSKTTGTDECKDVKGYRRKYKEVSNSLFPKVSPTIFASWTRSGNSDNEDYLIVSMNVRAETHKDTFLCYITLTNTIRLLSIIQHSEMDSIRTDQSITSTASLQHCASLSCKDAKFILIHWIEVNTLEHTEGRSFAPHWHLQHGLLHMVCYVRSLPVSAMLLCHSTI